MYPAALIYNPFAGRLRRDPSLLEAVLQRLGDGVRALPTTGPNMAGQLAQQAIAEGAERIYAFGGDGTVNEVANGMVGSPVALGVLPGGTANVLAVELGIGTRALRAADRMAKLQPRRIPLGRYTDGQGNSRHFLLMAGLGLDAEIVHTINPAVKKRLGKVAYWLGGFGAVWRRLPEFDVRLDGGPASRASFALIAKVRNYGGDLEIARSVRIDQEEFEVLLFEGEWAYRYLRYFSGVLLNCLPGMRGVTVARARRIEVGPGAPAQIDGEAWGHLPATIEMVPDALSLLIPDTYRSMPFLPLPDPWLVVIALICAVAPLLSLLVGSEMGAPRRSTGRSAALIALLLMLLWTGGRYIAYSRALAVLNSRLYDRQVPKRVEAVPNRWNPLAWRGLVETEKFTREVPVELWQEFDPDAGRTHYPPDDLEAVQSLEASEAYIRARSRMRWPVTQVVPGERMREITRYDLVTGMEVRLLVPNRPGSPAVIPEPEVPGR